MPGWRNETEWYEIFFLAKNNGKLLHVIVPLCATLTFCCFGKRLPVIGACSHRQLMKLVNKHIYLLSVPACYRLSRNCVVLIRLYGVFELSSLFLIFSDHPLFLSPSIHSLAFSFTLRCERSALTDVCEHILHILCVQTFSQPSNYVIFCSGFPLKRQSGLADRGMRKRWLNVSILAACASLLLSADCGEVIWSAPTLEARSHWFESSRTARKTPKIHFHLVLEYHEEGTCMSNYLDGAA